jgi:hypothetical protein
MAYLIDDHPEDDTPPVRPRRKVQLRKGSAKMAKPDQPLTKAVKPAPVPIAKSEAPDLEKVDLLDDDAPLAQLVKACSADPVFASTLRRRMDAPTDLEQRVSEQEALIGKVLAFTEPQSTYRHKNGNSVHLPPPTLTQSHPSSSSAHHDSYDDRLTEQLDKAEAADRDVVQQLTKAIQSDPRRDSRVATIRRLLGVTEASERARNQKLEARIAALRVNISKAKLYGSVVRPDHKDNNQSATHN